MLDTPQVIKGEDGKPSGIRCLVTQHDLPLRLEAIQAHWKGKAFRRALKLLDDVFRSEEDLPKHFTLHRNDPKRVRSCGSRVRHARAAGDEVGISRASYLSWI